MHPGQAAPTKFIYNLQRSCRVFWAAQKLLYGKLTLGFRVLSGQGRVLFTSPDTIRIHRRST